MESERLVVEEVVVVRETELPMWAKRVYGDQKNRVPRKKTLELCERPSMFSKDKIEQRTTGKFKKVGAMVMVGAAQQPASNITKVRKLRNKGSKNPSDDLWSGWHRMSFFPKRQSMFEQADKKLADDILKLCEKQRKDFISNKNRKLQDSYDLSQNHNGLVRKTAWYKDEEQIDPMGWKQLCQPVHERVAEMIEKMHRPVSPELLPGPHYLPPGCYRKPRSQREMEVYRQQRQAKEIKNLKFRLRPDLRTKTKKEQSQSTIKELMSGKPATIMIKTGRPMHTGLTDKQHSDLEDRGYKLDNVQDVILYHQYYTLNLKVSADQLYSKLDWNGSNTISMSELLSGRDHYQMKADEFVQIEYEGMSGDGMLARKNCFHFVDKDGDGLVSKEEWKILDEVGGWWAENKVMIDEANKSYDNTSKVNITDPAKMSKEDRARFMKDSQMQSFRKDIEHMFEMSTLKNAQAEFDGMDDKSKQLIDQVKQDHKISLDIAIQFKRKFDNFDKDNSGELDKQEFEPMLTSVMSLADKEQIIANQGLDAGLNVDKFWHAIDQDGQGTITFDEFVCWLVDCRDGNFDIAS